MAEARFKLILEAEDQTKKAIDSASKNLSKLKQDAGLDGKGGKSGVTLPPKPTSIQKASFDIKQAIINIRDNKGNVSSANQEFFTKLPDQKNKQGFSGVLKVDIVKSIPLNVNGIGRPGGTAQQTQGYGQSSQSWGGRNFPAQDSGGIVSAGGRAISPLAFGLGALVGTVVSVASKISQRYEQNVMEQAPLSGAVGSYRFGQQFVDTGRTNESFSGAEIRSSRNLQQEEPEQRTDQQRRDSAMIRQAQGSGNALISTLATTVRREAEDRGLIQRENRAERAGGNVLSQVEAISAYGLKPADIQRMAFEQARAGGAALTAQQYGDSRVFSGVAGYARATGIDPAQAAMMQGQLQRYGGSLQGVAGLGSGAGYRGAMNVEFVQAVTEAVKSGVQQGFSGTPEEIAKSMNMMINLKDQRGKALFGGAGGRDRGMAAYKTISSTMQSAGRLQGGNMQEIMLRSVIDDLQAQNPNMSPDELLQKAMEILQNPGNMQQVMSSTNRSMTSLYGTGAMRNIAMAQNLNTGITTATSLANANYAGTKPIRETAPHATVDEEARMVISRQNEQTALLMGNMGQNIFKAVDTVQRALLKLGQMIDRMAGSMLSTLNQGNTR